MNMMSERPLPARAIEQVVGEVLIRELARIIGEAEDSLARSREEALATLQRMERDRADLPDEAARRDYARAKAPAADVAMALGYHPSPDPEVRQQLYARTFAALRKVHGFERRLEEGDAVEASAERAGIPPQVIHEARQRRKGGGITVEKAFDAAIGFKYGGSRDNQNHARGLKRVALDFWGNVQLVSLTEDGLVELLLFARRLPVGHGRNHRNKPQGSGGLRR